MADNEKRIYAILYGLTHRFYLVMLWLVKKTGLMRTVMIMPYQGFGNDKELFFTGRVLKDNRIGTSEAEDKKWRNFKKMYKRFMTWKIPGVRVQATYNGITAIATTDTEGYYEFRMQLPGPVLETNRWLTIKLALLDKVVKDQNLPVVESYVFVPSEHVEFGVISDVDDTVVPTGATKFWQMLKTTFFGNAQTRVPFPGVAAFYHAMSKGLVGYENNPFYYVSSSPWNLYDFLREVMRFHGIPQGPLMLRDIGLSREYLFAGSHAAHKLVQIERIFAMYPDLPFILIGDSGQQDAEIYHQAIIDFPGKVRMVYIRDVDPASHAKVLSIGGEIKNLGVEMLLVKDTEEASLHAVSKGWILAEDVSQIVEEKQVVEKVNETLA